MLLIYTFLFQLKSFNLHCLILGYLLLRDRIFSEVGDGEKKNALRRGSEDCCDFIDPQKPYHGQKSYPMAMDKNHTPWPWIKSP